MRSLIFLSDEVTLFHGELGALPMHAHPTLALLYGFDQDIVVTLGMKTGRQRVQARCLLIDVGLLHEVDFANSRTLVIYPEPGTALWQVLKASLKATPVTAARGVQVVDDTGFMEHLLLHMTETLSDGQQVACALEAMRKNFQIHHQTDSSSVVDGRVARVIEHLYQGASVADEPDRSGHAHLAVLVHLSVSRLTHLFKQETGITLRLFQQWVKLRLAAKMLQEHMHLTHAAHDGGFADAAHFANAFKRTFGVTPTDIFRTQPAPAITWCAKPISRTHTN